MTLKKRSVILQAIEVSLFSLAIVGLGYLFDKSDPLLIHYEFSFLILWLAIVTLFYGLAMGLVMWTAFVAVSVFLYVDDPIFTTVLLENLAFVFLFGIFFSNLHNEIDKYEIKTKYLQLRLKELTSAFFTLKISHDKLESIYITQPASFRFVISDILESCDHNTPELSAKNTLKVLKKFFGVNSAMIYRVKKESLVKSVASIGDIDTKVNKNDTMIEEALAKKKAIYLKDLEDKEQTDYIYAVPFLDKQDEVVSMLIVKDIPFLFYNEDTLLKINVVFNYIWTEYKKRASLDRIRLSKNKTISLENNNHERQDIVDFKLEVVRLTNILDGFNIDSRIYVVSTQSEYLDKEIKDFLYQNESLEILDQYIDVQCGDNYIHFILFPFFSIPNIHKIAKGLNHSLEKIEEHSRIEILEHELEGQLSHSGYQGLRKKHISVKNFNALLEEYNCAR